MPLTMVSYIVLVCTVAFLSTRVGILSCGAYNHRPFAVSANEFPGKQLYDWCVALAETAPRILIDFLYRIPNLPVNDPSCRIHSDSGL